MVNTQLRSKLATLERDMKQLEEELDTSEAINQRRHAELEALRVENEALQDQLQQQLQSATPPVPPATLEGQSSSLSTSTAVTPVVDTRNTNSPHRGSRLVPVLVALVAIAIMVLDHQYAILNSGGFQFCNVDMPRLTV